MRIDFELKISILKIRINFTSRDYLSFVDNDFSAANIFKSPIQSPKSPVFFPLLSLAHRFEVRKVTKADCLVETFSFAKIKYKYDKIPAC